VWSRRLAGEDRFLAVLALPVGRGNRDPCSSCIASRPRDRARCQSSGDRSDRGRIGAFVENPAPPADQRRHGQGRERHVFCSFGLNFHRTSSPVTLKKPALNPRTRATYNLRKNSIRPGGWSGGCHQLAFFAGFVKPTPGRVVRPDPSPSFAWLRKARLFRKFS
jgi:hypothetical protein